jgi:hypothetical protein
MFDVMSDDNNKALATAPMLWRLNQIGLLDLRDEPGVPLDRASMKEVLGQAALAGLRHPVRGSEGGGP